MFSGNHVNLKENVYSPASIINKDRHSQFN
jgi:hypothetical protein